MAICGRRAFGLLSKISFERLGGTKEEEQAADILVGELATFGIQGTKEPFEVINYQINTAKLTVLAPYQQEYTVTGYGRTGCTPEGGLIAELLYVGEATEADLLQAEGKIVLLNGRVSLDSYERLCKTKVAGMIVIVGNVFENSEDIDLQKLSVFDKYPEYGEVPGVTLRAEDALELLKKGANKVKIELIQEDIRATSHNVVCEVAGMTHPEDVIVYTAHYDSVFFSAGANDNGAGSVILMELCRHFAIHPPERTLRFIWCGSEEYGLLGSFAYVKGHEEDLERIKLNINIDVAGGYIGRNAAVITGPQSLINVIDYLCKEIGVDMQVFHNVPSSDSVPFAEQGIPGVSFCRDGAPIHNRYDQPKYISAERLAELAQVVLLFSQRVVNAKLFPVERELPDSIKESLIKYLRSWRGAKMEIPPALKLSD